MHPRAGDLRHAQLRIGIKVSSNHSVGSLMASAPPGLKTDRDNLIKDNLDCYCQSGFEWQKERKAVLSGGKSRNEIRQSACNH